MRAVKAEIQGAAPMRAVFCRIAWLLFSSSEIETSRAARTVVTARVNHLWRVVMSLCARSTRFESVPMRAGEISGDAEATRFATDATIERFSRAMNYDVTKARATKPTICLLGDERPSASLEGQSGKASSLFSLPFHQATDFLRRAIKWRAEKRPWEVRSPSPAAPVRPPKTTSRPACRRVGCRWPIPPDRRVRIQHMWLSRVPAPGTSAQSLFESVSTSCLPPFGCSSAARGAKGTCAATRCAASGRTRRSGRCAFEFPPPVVRARRLRPRRRTHAHRLAPCFSGNRETQSLPPFHAGSRRSSTTTSGRLWGARTPCTTTSTSCASSRTARASWMVRRERGNKNV